jgi:carbamoyl-phosphate synthase small subunit
MNQTTLALADGTVFHGSSFGSKKETVGEVVFNTSMFGYQEILTDPSYVGQIVTMAYPHIGNVGTNLGDEESERPHAVGMIAHAFSEPSNWRSTKTLNQYLEGWGLAGLEGIDTRKLVRHLRTHGAQMGVISSEGTSDKALVEKAKSAHGMEGLDLATGISTKKVYTWNKGSTDFITGKQVFEGKSRFKVVAIDYGLKVAMLHCLVDVGCEVTVVPAGTTAEQVLSYNPDGIFLTNGPGDPAAVIGADKTVAALLGKKPLFGICLGHQILALALGAKTWKMKFGHRGANQPVKDLITGKVEITSQNHGFAVDAKTLGTRGQVTHLNLNDQTVEGLAVPDAQAWSVQYHPEASPGPHDARHLFQRFTDAMAARQ